MRRTSMLVAVIALVPACGSTRDAPPVALVVTSTAFASRAAVPRDHTCDGADSSPPLAWRDVPDGTRTFAIVMDDPDAPNGTWVHWVLWNIPGAMRSLPSGIPTDERLALGAVQGRNDFSRVGWGGPCPPPGAAHHYSFRVYALDALLTLPPGSTKAKLEQAMHGHVLARGELVGTHSRAR